MTKKTTYKECRIYDRATGDEILHSRIDPNHPKFREYFPEEYAYVLIWNGIAFTDKY
jgi:hypothetical protein|tara:strand:+ start:190 stop:360 length:171 start_codon:yes stop_codon:yes gene_type:complete